MMRLVAVRTILRKHDRWSGRLALVSLALVSLASACHLLGGYSDFDFDANGKQGAGGSAGGSTGGSTGSGGGESSTTISSGGGENKLCDKAGDCTSPKICKQGSCLLSTAWAQHLPAPGELVVNHVAVSTGGQVRVAGDEDGSALFIAQLDATSGNLLNQPSASYSGSADSRTASGVSSNLVTGTLEGTIDFGEGQKSAVGEDILLVGLNNSFTTSGKLYGGSGNQTGAAVAVAASGTAFILGDFDTSFEVGTGTVTNQGSRDVFLMTVASNGNPSNLQGFGTSATERAYDVIVDGSDNLIMAMGIGANHTLDFGDGDLATGVAIVKYSAATTFQWSFGYGNPTPFIQPSARALAADDAGNILIAGNYMVAFNIGTDMHGTPPGSKDNIYLAKLEPSGAFGWSRTFGDAETDSCRAIAVDGDGNIMLVGSFSGTIDFGGGLLTAVDDNPNAFVAYFNTAGEHIFSQRFGSDATARAVAYSSQGSAGFIVAGTFNGSLDLSSGGLQAGSTSDGFVAHFVP